MENPDANQLLPEVDALPDGFVDSSPENIAPSTPIFERETPVNNQKRDVVELEPSMELASVESEKSYSRAEKLRTFPVPLTENVDANIQATEVLDKVCVEQSDSVRVMKDKDCISEVLAEEHGCRDANKKAVEGSTEKYKTVIKDTSSSESTDLLKNRKQETTETKRKNTKRSFKSEKEYLEFTLKHQQIMTERDSAYAVRDKLESLCRELQRQNKVLMDECKRVSSEGQNLRLDLSKRFQDAIMDVSSKLEEQKNDCLSQIKENETLRNKLKQLVDSYTLSEEHHAQEIKQKNLELQIAELKIKQCEEKLVLEKSQMKQYAEEVSKLLGTEKHLRLQLTADGEKFQQFQDALLKSNEVFETFKQEIEKMAKSIKELKKENLFLKNKAEKSDVVLIELLDEREGLKKQSEKMKKQKEKLESLCRSLQAERKQVPSGSTNTEFDNANITIPDEAL